MLGAGPEIILKQEPVPNGHSIKINKERGKGDFRRKNRGGPKESEPPGPVVSFSVGRAYS
jgi:hypothetical protein